MNRNRLQNPNNIIYFLTHAILALIGYILILKEYWVFQAVGASLVATGVTGWVIFIYVRQSQRVSQNLELLSEFGLASAFDSRGTPIKPEYDRRLSKAHKRIDIMGFGLRALREDYQRDFVAWKSRAKVRILLLDPEYPSPDRPFGNQRDREEGNPDGTISGDVKLFAREVSDLIDDCFEIRLYRCLPAVNIFRVDDELFWGPYLAGKVSRNSPTFVVMNPGSLFATFTHHFEAIWNTPELSRAIPEAWL